jgi:hypothetical protein
MFFQTELVGIVPVGSACPADGGGCYEQDTSNNGQPTVLPAGSICDPFMLTGESCYETLVGSNGLQTDYFNWTDSFNGHAGGIAVTANLVPVDPGSGAGGITIISVNGNPVSAVPEPSSITMLALSLCMLLGIRLLIQNRVT